MRKAELKVGEEYAAGSTSRHDKWRLARVRLVELDGVREFTDWRGKRRVRGIVVALVEDQNEYLMRGKAGEEKVLPSARDIIELWAPYAERKAEQDRQQGELRAERERVRDVAGEVQTRMAALGLPEVDLRDGVFRIDADKMAEIVARIPDGR